MIKKFNDFLLNESTDGKRYYDENVQIDPQEIIDRLKSGKITIDFRRPKDMKPVRKEYIDDEIDSMIRVLEYDKKKYGVIDLPYDFHGKSYDHPVTGEYCYFTLVDMDKITLATLEKDDKGYYFQELPIPETLIKGDFYSFELDIPSGKMCFCGDWVRDIFVEKDWDDKGAGDYHRVERDAIQHINSFLKKGYFFVADAFYADISKKDDTYYVYRENEVHDENMGEHISEINIDSDHTMVIIDNNLLNKKLRENKEEYDKLSSFNKKYLKYCLDVEPGKYKIDFNWRFGVKNEDDTLVYFIISKI